ncbi:hypothetical protein X772_01900 [Mesorhizobium sp. LSJC280B00]|nr:hypothetical protein X772_01900 [Mesorhizobium sp. LSJC280B00]
MPTCSQPVTRTIGDNLDLSHGEIATALFYLAGLIVDDPVADACFDVAQILVRKLVLRSGAVIVDRI